MKKIVAIILAILLMAALLPTTAFAAGETKTITTSQELAQAIRDQADGQTWLLAPNTTFDLTPELFVIYKDVELRGEKEFVFPITADNLTIKGGEGTVITSSVVAPNPGGGNWHWQNFITIEGDNVTLDTLTLIPNKNEYEIADGNPGGVNKLIEILGSGSIIRNLRSEPRMGDFSGSIYYSNPGSSDILKNVYLSKGRVCVYGRANGTLTMENVTIDFTDACSVAPNFFAFERRDKTANIVNATNVTILMSQARIDSYNSKTPEEVKEEGITFVASDKSSDVTASADVAFTFVITPNVDFGKINRKMGILERDFIVSIEDAIIEDGAAIKVANNGTNMVMRDKDGTGNKTLPFTLENQNFTFTQDELKDGNASKGCKVKCNTSKLEAAGSYKGYMTFTVSYIAP